MTLAELLLELRRADIELWLDGDRLRFSAPPGALTPSLRAVIAERRAEIVALLQETSAAAMEQAPIAALPRTGPSPVSPAQRRLWFLEQLDPGTSRYNIPAAVRLRGPLDVDAFARSLTECVRRHEPLRTRLVVVDGEPFQVVDPPASVELPIDDLRRLPAAARDAEARRWIRGEAERAFDLARGPLLRARLLRTDDEDVTLLLTLHHAIADGWSMEILVREVGALYEALVRGRPSPLPELAVQYVDYVRYHADWLRGGREETQLAYWKQTLAGAAPRLELGKTSAGPASLRGARSTFTLAEATVERLREHAKQAGVTPFIVLLAAFSALLHRYTGQGDLSIGTPVAGRARREVEPLVGLFVNTLVLRVDLSGDPSFAQLVGRVRDVTLGALANQDVPFERVVEVLQPARDPAQPPLFEVSFALQSALLPGASLAGVEVTRLPEPEVLTPKFAFSLTITDGGATMRGSFEYDTARFDADTIERLSEHLVNLLRSALSAPTAALSRLPLLSPSERDRILRAGHPKMDAERRLGGETVHGLVEAQAARTPEATAIEFERGSLTYAALNAKANQLARHLVDVGVGREALVAVALDRSLEMVITLLAVLKAGGAYVPIDPAYPSDRVRLMREDSGARLLVDGAMLAERAAEIARYPTHDLSLPVSGDQLAYVIYTSGSTGRPKGVMVPHRGVVSVLGSMTREPGMRASDALVAVTSISFDIAAVELLLPLSVGGRVILASREVATDADALAELLRSSGATVMQATPSTWRMLLARGFRGDLRALCGGEAMPADVAKGLLGATSAAYNLYGPTETSIWSACWTLVDGERVCIGRPVASTRMYVLDRHLEPVPFGVGGELFIGGVGVVRGYLQRRGSTAERFLPDPFGSPGARMYRTGDIARLLPDGSFDFMGRTDAQIKLRGFRIELGEIEAFLGAVDGVRAAAAAVQGERLIGYVVGRVSPADVRRALERSLPEHMIPSAIVCLDELPVTPNGKLDRKALPAPALAVSETITAPRTATEVRLSAIWSSVLGCSPWLDVSFFESGGHSLLATRLVSRVRDEMGVALPLRAVFEAPTIARLAERIDALAASSTAAIPRAEPDTDAALSFAQERLWFLDQLGSGSPLYNIPCAVRLRGPLDVRALERAIGEVIRRHEALRTTIAPGPVQRVAEPFAVDLTPEDVGPEEVSARAAAAAGRPFDLARGPLIIAELLRVSASEHVLLFTLHHAVADGWSLDVLLSEVGACYGAFAQGATPDLADLPIQYRDYAAWQRSPDRERQYEAELTYWRDQLRGAPAALDLPTDRPRTALLSRRAGTHLFSVAAAPLKELCARRGVTLFMALLAALDVLLARHTGQRDLVVGTPVAGRSRSELEPLVGLFVNTLALRVRVEDDPTFLDLLSRVRDAALDAYAHQDVPFERVVAALDVPRDLGRAPVFQVMLALAVRGRAPATVGEVSLEVLPTVATHARFEWTFAFEDRGDTLAAALEYDADLFDAETIERVVAHVQNLLAAVTRSPEARVSTLPLFSEAERSALVAVGKGAGVELAASTIHALVEARAAVAPDAVALTRGAETMTLGALDRRANQLARYLRLPRGARVGVSLERSTDLVVTTLALLKLGAACVPLDPSYPPGRLELMRVGAGIVETIDARRLAADRDAIDAQPAEPLNVACTPDDLAYVIYTSGSTGAPKGVLIPHRAVVNHLRWMQGRWPLRANDVVAQNTSPSFDVSIWEMWGPLSFGARLAIPLADEALVDTLLRERVTVLQLVPSLLAALLDDPRFAEAPLRHVFCGGEALPPHAARRFFATARAELHNMYGPTEATIDATAFDGSPSDASGSIPIGAPGANMEAHVLDERLEPAPLGAVGQLHVGGAGLAWGYLDHPGSTALAFVPSPFGPPGARLYRTGDLARRRPDGAIEFAGRADRQVKLRGIRIELGEVEATLCAVDGVRAAAVVKRGDRLVAYVVGGGDDLKAALRARLPEAMVPSVFVSLDALPSTANGKLDIDALPSPPDVEDDQYVAPRTETERQVAALFSELLGARDLGVHAHFFELGGHSLLATRLASRLRVAFGADVPVRWIFEAPTILALAERIDAQVRRVDDAPLERATDGERTPSFTQRRLWFLEQLAPMGGAYNVPTAVRLTGSLDVPALRRSLQLVVQRHEVLRTTFVPRDGRPALQVCATMAVPWLELDLRGDVDPVAAARRAVRSEVMRPFDLERGPLLRAALVRVGDRDCVLVLTMHHIVSDGWSVEVLLRELVSALRGDPLPDLEIQFADHAAWQERRLAQRGDAELSHWKRTLEGAPPELGLPMDRPRPAVQTFSGSVHRMTLGREVWERVRAVSLRNAVTPFMTLLSVFAVLLGRHADQDDVVIGTPIANRTRRETEGLIGPFVNTLALRVDLSDGPTFAELLGRVRVMALSAYAHQEVPFERVVDALRVARDLSRSPLFQVMFALNDAPRGTLELPGVTAAEFEVERGGAAFDLSLIVSEARLGGAVAAFEYNTDLFDALTVERLARRFEVLLRAALEDAPRGVWDLAMLDDAEREASLVHARGGEPRTLEPYSLHERFDRIARLHPQIPAIGSLTYDELRRRSNAVAAALVRCGVGVESRVGICIERSEALVVAILAVLKAGAAYVPLDPAYPEERLRFMLADCGATVVLRPEDVTAAGVEDAPRVVVRAEGLAYAMYTSGSTGRPKAVLCTHGGLLTLLDDLQGRAPIRPGDRCSLWTSPSFDVSVYEVFSALLVGGTLLVPRDAERHEGRAYAEWLRDREITSAYVPPFMLREIGPGSLRRLLVGVEPIPEAILSALVSKGVVVINGYGPTETHVCATLYDVPAEAAHPGQAPIGRAVRGSTANLLDRRLGPVGPGMKGEIYVGGASVARGYLDRPAQTAARFVPDPHGPPGSRMYRTGDVARWLPDRNVEFVGRADHQIKLRGFRIEPGEIEASLLSCVGVERAAVVVREQRLIAYWTGEPRPAEALREALRARLPVHMVPAAFVHLPAFPVTSHGKLDRTALPVPSNDGTRRTRVPPANRIEEALVTIWADVLGVDAIGTDEDFFELGGHSLAATQVISRMRHELGIDLPLRALFDTTTISELASLVDRETARAEIELRPIPAAPVTSVDVDALTDEQVAALLEQMIEEGGADP